jgi:hypothetical protein
LAGVATFRRGALVAAALLVAGAGASLPGAASGDVPAALRDAVATLAAQRHGVIAFARHYAYDQRAPAHNKLIVADSARIRRDGTIVVAKLYRQTVDGTPSGPDEIAKEQAELNKDVPDEDYTLPLSPSALGDYTFGTPSPCASCEDGVVAVAFTSRKRDDDHGDGTAYVDGKNRHFVRLEFVPSVTPKGADSGSVTITFGRALADLWDVVAEKQRYTGHVLFIHGSADVTISNRNYRRFDSLEQARAAVDAGL